MKYEDSIEYIYSLPKRSFRTYGTKGVFELLNILENPQARANCIHVVEGMVQGQHIDVLC